MPPAAVVRPKAITSTSDELEEFLPPVDLEAPLTCNCFASNLRVCLVNFHPDAEQENVDKVVKVADQLNDLLLSQDLEESESDDERVADFSTSLTEDLDENVHEQETIEYFPVVGSNWEMYYQDGLNKCYQIQVRKKKIQLRVEQKPGNISDSNVLKFEVYSDGQ